MKGTTGWRVCVTQMRVMIDPIVQDSLSPHGPFMFGRSASVSACVPNRDPSTRTEAQRVTLTGADANQAFVTSAADSSSDAIPRTVESASAKCDVVEFSIILPCFNEERALPALVAEVDNVFTALKHSFEIVIVDDKSSDQTVAVSTRLRASHPSLRVVRHVRNCGQSAAVATGFRNARGRVVVTLDADGQNDPNELPRLIDRLGEADVICEVRTKRHDSWIRRVSSRVGNGFRNIVTGDHVTDAGCALRVLRAEVARELPVFNGLHRFIPTIARAQGFRVLEVGVNHRERTTGVSKYWIGNRALRGIYDCFAIRWWRARAIPARRFETSATPAEANA